MANCLAGINPRERMTDTVQPIFRKTNCGLCYSELINAPYRYSEGIELVGDDLAQRRWIRTEIASCSDPSCPQYGIEVTRLP